MAAGDGLAAAEGEPVVAGGVMIGCTAIGDGEEVTFDVRTTPHPARAIEPTRRQLTATNVRRAGEGR